ncbi:MAG: hypothetical protein C0432_03820 [Candidatus Puniceispirillum sp.]|nr:hypothetical protein [Candidatus Pelagibacter sp.]MBA4283403.1 hypothetical protein [Candidatus Puniceispirillum sp.]
MKNMKFNPEILEIIYCPKTHKRLQYDEEKEILYTNNDETTYAIKNGVPLLDTPVTIINIH